MNSRPPDVPNKALQAKYDRLYKAAAAMGSAYAGEQAAKSAGMEIYGFPLLEAWQALWVELYGDDEGRKFGRTWEGKVVTHD